MEDEIRQTNLVETERLKQKEAQKEAEWSQHMQKVYKEEVDNKNFWRLMIIIFVIFAVPMVMKFCSLTPDHTDSTDYYYRK